MLYPIENKVREVKNLSGVWNFKFDRKNEGFVNKWYEDALTDTVPMAVPASYNDLFIEAWETYFDFFNYSGIHRPVKIYTTPKKYIKDIVIKTDITGIDIDNNVAKSAVVKAWIDATDKIKCVKVIDEQGNIVAQESLESIKEEKEYYVEIEVCNSKIWQPGKAYLYDLRVEGDNDVYTEQFGFRTIEVTDKELLINGKSFYFKGFGKHEDSDIHGKGLDDALNIRDFNLLKWIGANSFRTSHYPYSEELMMLADREGFVLIDEVPAVGMCFWDGQSVFGGNRVNSDTLKHHKDMLYEMYWRDKNHPCVIMWSVANEAATHEEGAVPYFKEVIDTMRQLDDSRPITIVHTTGPDGDKVSQWVDVICLNRYDAWYTDHGHKDVIGVQMTGELNKWFNKYHKPMIISEYGADTILGLHKLPSYSFTEEFQCEFLTEYHKVFDSLDFVIGEHVWAFADFQTKMGVNRVDGNKKGVFTRNRQPKMSAYMLRERWK